MSRRMLLALLVVLAAAAAGRDVLGADDGSKGAGRSDQSGRVVRVVDGDTIHVLLAGRREKVRYIGVDTPALWSRRCDSFNSRAGTTSMTVPMTWRGSGFGT